MSAAQFVEAIAVFQGAQGKFYLVNGRKYHIRFPMEWAHNHMTISINGYEDKSGPKDCGNCDVYGSIRGVFVGYCSNCLRNYIETGELRGNLVAPGLSVNMLRNEDIWAQYPYMYGVKKSEIGDEEGAEVTDEGINLERLEHAIRSTEEEMLGETSDNEDDETVCDNSHDDVSVISDDATINS